MDYSYFQRVLENISMLLFLQWAKWTPVPAYPLTSFIIASSSKCSITVLNDGIVNPAPIFGNGIWF